MVRRKRGRAWIIVGLLACFLCVCGVAFVLRLNGLQNAANVAQLTSIPIALVEVVLLLVTGWQSLRPSAVTVSAVAEGREMLARRLLVQWQEESRARALDDPDPIPVRWRITEHEDLIDLPSNRTADVLTVASSADVLGLIDEFRKLRRHRLVILGDAGAGKTTLAVQILLALLGSRADHPGEPVPVLFSLTGWRPADYHGDVRKWLADRLDTDYPELPAGVVGALLEEGQILPILDGLDEAPYEAREHFIPALHRSLGADTQLILTSRTDEFAAAVESGGRVMSSAVVIQPDALSPEAAAEYLRRCLPPDPGSTWSEILERLADPAARQGPVAALAEVASTPLGLWLIRAAYISPRADPSLLLDDTLGAAPAMQAHLFEVLVAACITARRPSADPAQLFRPRREYSPVEAEAWLRFLAQNLQRWKTNDLNWAWRTVDLAAPPRWTDPLIIAAERISTAVDRFAEQPIRTRRAIGVGALLGVPLLFCGSATAGDVGFLPFLALCTAVVLVIRILIIRIEHAGSGGPYWPAAVEHDWYAVRAFVVRAGPTLAFSFCYASVTGLPAGIVTELILRDGSGMPVGLAVGAVVGLLALLIYVDGLLISAGIEPNRPWYGIGPGPGLRSGLFWAAIAGILGGFLLVGAYGGAVGPTTTVGVAFFLVSTAAGCFLIVPFRAVIVPLLFTVSNLGAAILAPRSGRPNLNDTISIWESERIGQIRRLVRVGILTSMAALLGGLAWRYLRNSAIGADLFRQTPTAFLSKHVPDFDLTWTGHLRYVAAAAVGWFLTIPLAQPYRRWRGWGAWLLAASLVVGLWPKEWEADNFRLHLVGRLDGADPTITMNASARFAEHSGAHSAPSLHLAEMLSGADLRVAVLIWLGVVGFFAVATILGRIEGGYSRVWWSTWMATRWHVVQGRLPYDPIAFFDDAHRLGLLRRIGLVYQFRHAEFQDHLVTPDEAGT
ncbi:NACHT domain-containing protein [Actinoplanes regularis]|uniref:NACHT domain-containing protein n=1 Tax=Actinoplanes regularis TaxID=52697 RepID=A0A238V4Z0_9ACTN|nr:NACHT domain-containing protein [Actinoplanes regularis]SNR29326.1 NACHT domain-containing protein [Actinoplanes regularis]